MESCAFPGCRSAKTVTLLSAVSAYDDGYRLLQHSLGGYMGGIKSVFSECPDWKAQDAAVSRGRHALAVCSLIQTMWNANSATRGTAVAAALAKCPKTGPTAVNVKLAKAASAMAQAQ